MTVAAVIVAAGRGTRAGGTIPKQFQMLDGESVLIRTIRALTAHPEVNHVVVVIHPDDRTRVEAAMSAPGALPVDCVPGGATRDASVRAGLAVLPPEIDRVLIHDAARPLVTTALVERVLRALDTLPGAAPALAISDALWRGAEGRVAGTQDRSGLYRAQTPQGFHRAAIDAAHAVHPGNAADDVEVARAHGLDVAIVDGDEDNIKITLPGDFARAARILRQRKETGMDIRLGNGFDVHAFAPGDAVILCGVRIPHDQALFGHSDADVAMHAVTDAIYGALADGDIGQHFPPSDPQWKGAESHIFLRHAVSRAAARGYRVGNADCTIVCEAPKIAPHAAAMRGVMAELLAVPADRVSVKATTAEQLGFIGRREGIAALASVTLVAT
ncbi:MAG: bifunctional 2-C-methyl-D-erythritol 4-phosphate cytidylyltransferase/2-C-methyl-D-erythritol 2,4-cyclodiphosphate synthase [Rhodobacteraceae bacterium]|nr:bifunctional 2-C-methyl-D-erythritol 4-phosphate cytidylyltransferase/2-C-methyl-D-erythritol 2,4-cyclodiphosphate synthase [Paracoccaceae bacterium]